MTALKYTFGTSTLIYQRVVLSVCTKSADVALILDTSGSTTEEWLKAVEFSKGLIDTLPIGEFNVRVAVITFSNQAYIEFDFKADFTTKGLKRKLDHIGHKGANTNTSGGIRMATSELFNNFRHNKYGGRADVRDVGIVVTDGHSTRDTHLLKPESDLAHRMGIQLYVIRLPGKTPVSTKELGLIASDPDTAHVFDLRRAQDAVDNSVVLWWEQCAGDYTSKEISTNGNIFTSVQNIV